MSDIGLSLLLTIKDRAEPLPSVPPPSALNEGGSFWINLCVCERACVCVCVQRGGMIAANYCFTWLILEITASNTNQVKTASSTNNPRCFLVISNCYGTQKPQH